MRFRGEESRSVVEVVSPPATWIETTDNHGEFVQLVHITPVLRGWAGPREEAYRMKRRVVTRHGISWEKTGEAASPI